MLDRLIVSVAAAVLWVFSFLFSLATLDLLNDHFYRISSARQIAVYSEIPFRDFFDPGFFMTELASAALQRLLGDNLLGEALLVTASIATGTVLVFVLARRLSQSLTIALIVAVVALAAAPRAYDYDKVLFYPLGLLLCWRYAERSTTGNLWMLAAGAVAGGLFDTTPACTSPVTCRRDACRRSRRRLDDSVAACGPADDRRSPSARRLSPSSSRSTAGLAAPSIRC